MESWRTHFQSHNLTRHLRWHPAVTGAECITLAYADSWWNERGCFSKPHEELRACISAQPSTPEPRAAGVWLCLALPPQAAPTNPLNMRCCWRGWYGAGWKRARVWATAIPALHHLGDLRPLVAVQLVALEENVVLLLVIPQRRASAKPCQATRARAETDLWSPCGHPGG